MKKFFFIGILCVANFAFAATMNSQGAKSSTTMTKSTQQTKASMTQSSTMTQSAKKSATMKH